MRCCCQWRSCEVSSSVLFFYYPYDVGNMSFASRNTQPSKRKADDDLQQEDDSGTSPDRSVQTLHGPATSPSAAAGSARHALPNSLKPIRVLSAAPLCCPIQGCGRELDAKDSTWRVHFLSVHHDELCLTANCAGVVARSCKVRCPLTPCDAVACAGDEGQKRRRVAKTSAGGAITIENFGRHVLNVHVKVVYRCPLCGLESEWREWACARHMKACSKKLEKQPTRS